MRKEHIALVNTAFSMRRLMQDFGIDIIGGGSCNCPFTDHHSAEDANKSAKFYEKTNSLFCFTARKRYGPYDLLKELGKTDEQLLAFLRQRGLMDLEVSRPAHTPLFPIDVNDLKFSYRIGVISSHDLLSGLYKTIGGYCELRQGRNEEAVSASSAASSSGSGLSSQVQVIPGDRVCEAGASPRSFSIFTW